MHVRPVDENGDMMPVMSVEDLVDGTKAIGTIAHARMSLIRGEWWEDETLGFMIVQYLIDSAKESENNFLMNYITSYLMETEGCTGITDVKVSYEDRQLIYSCNMHTATDSTELEVTEDELLGSIY